MLATGGKTFINKGIALLPLSAMKTSMNPCCNAIQPVTRRVTVSDGAISSLEFKVKRGFIAAEVSPLGGRES